MISAAGASDCLEVLSRVIGVGMVIAGRNGRLEFANDTALALLGVEAGEMRKRWPDLRRLLQISNGWSSAPAKAKRTSIELPQAGGMRSLRLEMHPLRGEDAGGCLVLLRDRRAGDVLETDLLLASRMRSLVHVYRVLAHDVKAPLNAMQLTLELLADSSADDDGSHGRARRTRHLEVLREELARLNRILQTMLDQKEPMETLSYRFDLREVIREIVVLLAPQARVQRVELRILLPDNPVSLQGCRDRIKQALLNVAINCLEAMPEGGRLEICLSAAAAEVTVRVADTGPGIPDELLEAIDQVYFTGKSSGSGLYVARRVVESHGGEIIVQSQPGSGSAFTISLPLRSEARARAGVVAAGGRA